MQDVFEQAGSGGLPPEIRRRTLVDACCYGVRTGGAWRMLPTHFPRWQNVHRTFRRWSEQGNFERMHERLGAQWRQRQARPEAPTAAGWMPSPHGFPRRAASAALMPGRRSRDASALDRGYAGPVVGRERDRRQRTGSRCCPSGGDLGVGGQPGRPRRWPGKRHADKADDIDRCRHHLKERGITPRIARKGIERNDRLGRHRWVVERTHAWFAGMGKLRIRFERRIDIHLAWLSLACSIICLRLLLPTTSSRVLLAALNQYFL
ncbi:transposase [Xanthomonas theicola]|uniref:transposase n=1 Tax=Xanthomonas theicola TaxID=56464 RepID=UPI0011B012A6